MSAQKSHQTQIEEGVTQEDSQSAAKTSETEHPSEKSVKTSEEKSEESSANTSNQTKQAPTSSPKRPPLAKLNRKLVITSVAGIVVLVGIIVAGWWFYSATPEQSMQRMYSAIEAQNYDKAKKYIDSQKIAKDMIQQSRELGNEVSEEEVETYQKTLNKDIRRAVNEGQFMYSKPTDIQQTGKQTLEAKIDIFQSNDKATGYFEKRGRHWVFVGYDFMNESATSAQSEDSQINSQRGSQGTSSSQSDSFSSESSSQSN